MLGLGLLCGHLVGDYLLQNGWMAMNKANPLLAFNVYDRAERSTAYRIEIIGHLACLTHCLIYTLAVWAFAFQWITYAGLCTCFVAHFIMDRFALAKRWMMATEWHRGFATGPLAPWSIVVIDNTVHLVTLYVIALATIHSPH